MIYDIYHDESKEEAYWHGFLFVPRMNRSYLLDLLNEARRNTDYFYQVHYKKIRSYKKRTAKKLLLLIHGQLLEYPPFNSKNYINFHLLFILVDIHER